MATVKPADLEPGMSVYDEAFPLRARFVHSIEKVGKGYVVRFGHPDGDPEDDPDDLGRVKAGTEYHLIANADGSRPTDGDLPALMDTIRSITEDSRLSADDRLGRIRDVLGSLDQMRNA